jgi:predicted nuclease of predicted toxin-antitoxin system
MKFLLDSNLSHRVAQLLREAGIDAAHVRDKDLQHATDLTILVFARQHSFVPVSEDTDFGELLARQHTVAPSFVLCAPTNP